MLAALGEGDTIKMVPLCSWSLTLLGREHIHKSSYNAGEILMGVVESGDQ